VTRQKIKGGMLVQKSSFGYSQQLRTVTNPDGSIKYMEVMMPFPTDKIPKG
jgi:hypothetical protein